MSSRKAVTAKPALRAGATAKVAKAEPAANTAGHKPAGRKAAGGKAAGPESVARKSVASKPGMAKAAAAKPARNGASVEAKQLATTIERDLRNGRHDTLTPEAFQALMAALCKSYGTQLEAGADFLPVADRTSVSPTEIMTTTSGLLKAANLAVFELGMWQSWTGR